MIYPDFIIAGAAKCGSSALYEALKKSPYIDMGLLKQPRIFDFKERQTRKYLESNYPQYTNDDILKGDASVQYFSNPKSLETIHHLNPDCKVIFTVRNPIERSYSDFWQKKRTNREFRSWNQALLDSQKKLEYFIEDSMYHKNISRYRNVLPKKNLHIIIFEELIKNPTDVLNQLCNFLNISNKDIVLEKTNPSSTFKYMWIYNFFYYSPLNKFYNAFLSNSSKKIIRKFSGVYLKYVSNKINYKDIAPEEVAYLVKCFQEDTKKLCEEYDLYPDWKFFN